MRFFSGRAHYTCHVCENPRHSIPQCVNPYANLVLEHARDEQGNPVRVTSKRQLLEAEKRYKFKSLVANWNSENFDKPPQLTPPCAADRIAAQVADVQGKRDAQGNRLGFMYPEIAAAQLKEIKEKGIDIDTW